MRSHLKVDDYEIPEGLYYTKEHEWLKLEGDTSRVGITDYAQKTLHEIVFVDLPDIGKKVGQMDSLGTVESVKAVSDVFSPVSGEVVERNEKLSNSPEILNQDPYRAGWIVGIKPSKLKDELKNLLDAKGYGEYVAGLKK